MDRPLVERALATVSAKGGAEWAGPNDISVALQLTGSDEKAGFAAAHQLIRQGKPQLMLATVAMGLGAEGRSLLRDGWTLHWSNSQTSLFYSNLSLIHI